MTENPAPWGAVSRDWGPPQGEPVGPHWLPAGPPGLPMAQPGLPMAPPGPPPLAGSERVWVPAVHWLPLVSTWLGPLLVLLTVGERNGRVRGHAAESLNFELTFALAMLASALLLFAGIGIVPLLVLPPVWAALRVNSAVRATRGHPVIYPVALRLVR